jgi:hypothetical protein
MTTSHRLVRVDSIRVSDVAYGITVTAFMAGWPRTAFTEVGSLPPVACPQRDRPNSAHKLFDQCGVRRHIHCRRTPQIVTQTVTINR